MLSQTSEYALRAMVWLAKNWSPEKELYFNVMAIAKETRVPQTYLAKILQTLTHAHLLKIKRGIRGGFCLNQPPKAINLLSIIENFDAIERIHTCPLKLEEHAHALCPLHSKLDEMACSMRASFSCMSLSDLINPSLNPLCQL